MKKIYLLASFAFTINVFAQCNAAFTFTTSTSGVNITNTSTGTNGTTTFNLNLANASTNLTATNGSSFSSLYNGTYTLTLFMTDSSSCQDSVAKVITISGGANAPACNTSFTYSVGAAGAVSFTNTSPVDPLNNTVYVWTFGNPGMTSNSSSPTYNYAYNGTYTVILNTSNNKSSCYASSTQTITVTTASVAPACNSNFTYTLGTSGQVNFTGSYTGAAYSFYWTFGDGSGNQGSATTSRNYQYNGTYSVTLNVEDSLANCFSSTTQTLSITNTATPAACVAVIADSLLGTGTVSFINASYGTSVGASTLCTWDFADGTTSSLQNPSHTYTANGTYVVSLQITDSSQSCSSTATASVTITNAVPPACLPSITFNMHQDSLNPQPHVWEISSYYSSQVTSAIWYWGDGTSTAGLSPAHTYSAAGKYTICVTAYSSCGDSASTCMNDSLYRLNQNNGTNSVISVTVINVNHNQTTGMKTGTQGSAQVSIYPNPSAGLFTLQLNNISANVSNAQITVTNILGEVIYSSQEQINNNGLSKNIDLQNVANGAYFMKVSVGGRTYTNKTIISK